MRRMFRALRLIGLIAGFVAGTATTAMAAPPQDWHYTVRNTDTLWDICARYVAEPLCWIKLGRHNALPNPDYIAPGSRIRIPYRWLKTPPLPAEIIYRKGDLRYIPAAATAKIPWSKATQIPSLAALQQAGVTPQPLPQDNRLYMGDRLLSGEGSAVIRFADGSELTLRPHSDIIFDRISVKGKTGFVDTLLILKQGATVNKVKPGDRLKSRFSIDTTAGVAAVRGTEYRVSVEPAEVAVMRSEVLAGEIAVSGTVDNHIESVASGYGVRTEQGQPVPPPRKLLPAVTWDRQYAGPQVPPMTLSWQPLPKAQSYQLDLYDNNGLIATHTMQTASYHFRNLDDGAYRVVVRALDDVGLKGLDAQVSITLETPLAAPVLSLDIAPSATAATISWRALDQATEYRVEVAADPQFNQLIEDKTVMDTEYSLRSHRVLYLRVSGIDAEHRPGKPSSVVVWQPEADFTRWLVGAFAALLIIAVL